jgi:poly(ADP-ribose) glycohydrolase ARH3
MPASAARRDRVRGALLGLACGDALGAPFEGQPSVPAPDAAAWEADTSPLRVTDDTILTMVLAEHLAIHGGRVDQDQLALAFARAWLADPGRGYGGGVRNLFAQVIDGTPWREASASQFGGMGSLGNGAAMRVTPVGVICAGPGQVASLAHQSAAVTHAHRLGKDGAALQACAVSLALAGQPSAPVTRAAWCRQLSAAVASPLYTVALNRVAAITTGNTPAEVASCVGNGVEALEAVPAALAAFLAHPGDPSHAIRFAIAIGGDTDTIAAMAGALAGAHCGASALPHAWLRRLEFAGQLTLTAGRLADATCGDLNGEPAGFL